MTEKRFTIKEFSTLDAMASIDVICDEGIELPTSTACDLLNALHEEKEYWKQKYKQEVEKHSIISASLDENGNWHIIPKEKKE